MVASTHPVDEVLPFGQMLAVGIQHVLVMYAGAIAVPLIIGAALKLPKDQVAFLISSDLFACGLVTLIQCIGIWKFGIRLPVIMGVSFAPVGPMVAMANSGAGLTGIFGATMAAGVFAILIAPFFGRLMRFFPPIVTGTIILTIGFTLFPVAINWAGGGRGSPTFGDPRNLLIAVVVLLAILVINKYLKGFLANISVLLGMVIGFLIALPMGFVDFSGIGQAAWFAPVRPFAFGMPTFDIAAIASLCLVMVVIMVESLGMFLALGDLARRPVSRDDASRGLRTDGLGTLIGGIFNTFPHSSFSQNIGLVGITGVRSRWVVVVSGVLLMLLGLLAEAVELHRVDSRGGARRRRNRNVRDGRRDGREDTQQGELREQEQSADRGDQSRRRLDSARRADFLPPDSVMGRAAHAQRHHARGDFRDRAERVLQSQRDRRGSGAATRRGHSDEPAHRPARRVSRPGSVRLTRRTRACRPSPSSRA